MKSVIYLRTSTEEQNPENQLEECKRLYRKLNLSNGVIFREQQSAFKDKKREVFSRIVSKIKQGQISSLVCWDLDRLYRNRQKLLEFFNFCKAHNCKIYSVRQEFLNAFDNLNLPQGFEFLAEMYRNNFLQFLGWISEEESVKKSARVKSAVRTSKNGKTYSYKGHKWGRKSIITKRIREEIKELKNQGLSIREIAKRVYYYDKSNNKKQISPSLVYKIINKQEAI